jgi:hypothetical protein
MSQKYCVKNNSHTPLSLGDKCNFIKAQKPIIILENWYNNSKKVLITNEF